MTVILGELPANGFPWQAVKSNGRLLFVNPVAKPRLLTPEGLIEVDFQVPSDVIVRGPVPHTVPSVPSVVPPAAAGYARPCPSCQGVGRVPGLRPGTERVCASCEGSGIVTISPLTADEPEE